MPEWDQCERVRTQLERHVVANRENIWNGRPISLIVLAEPQEVLDGASVPLIGLMPPVHQRVYRMSLERLEVMVVDTFDSFVDAHKPALTGQQFLGPMSTADPVYILRPDFTHVELGRHSSQGPVESANGTFEDGFRHVDGWVPQYSRHRARPEPVAAPSGARNTACEHDAGSLYRRDTAS